MRFEIIEIKRNEGYGFLIGTLAKPDDYLKERIRTQIREAMESLGREPESYSVSIVRNEEEDLRESSLPSLEPGKNYLIFAILSSGDSAESLSERELEEQQKEIARGIIPPSRSKVTLVLLYDALVRVIVTEKSVYDSRGIIAVGSARRR